MHLYETMASSLSVARLIQAEVAADGDSLRKLPTTSEGWKRCVITSASFFFPILFKAVLQPCGKPDGAAGLTFVPMRAPDWSE